MEEQILSFLRKEGAVRVLDVGCGRINAVRCGHSEIVAPHLTLATGRGLGASNIRAMGVLSGVVSPESITDT